MTGACIGNVWTFISFTAFDGLSHNNSSNVLAASGIASIDLSHTNRQFVQRGFEIQSTIGLGGQPFAEILSAGGGENTASQGLVLDDISAISKSSSLVLMEASPGAAFRRKRHLALNSPILRQP